MTSDETPRESSPFHAGERQMQAALGVAERMDVVGRRIIRDFMPEQHRELYRELPFLVLGSVDAEGRPWASLIEGRPGFIQSPDERALQIDHALSIGDPARPGVTPGAAIGLLGIELSTRRRNRMNGRVTHLDERGFSVRVEQAFGNCPQYIQRRELAAIDQSGSSLPTAPRTESLTQLDTSARALLTGADTFFVASYVDVDGYPDRRAVDVSHRGGRPGFVRVEGDRLTIPDFPGNLQFNTLGNLVSNPRAGLLFADFETGELLQLSGRTEIVEDAREVAAHPGAERLWRVEVQAAVRRRAALELRFQLRDFSPRTLSTGTWDESGR